MAVKSRIQKLEYVIRYYTCLKALPIKIEGNRRGHEDGFNVVAWEWVMVNLYDGGGC